MWLKEVGLFPRTVFVMPVSLQKKQKEHYKKSWSDASKRLEEGNIHLPEYDASGKVFTVGVDGEVEKLGTRYETA